MRPSYAPAGSSYGFRGMSPPLNARPQDGPAQPADPLATYRLSGGMNWIEFDWDTGNEDKVLARASEDELREAFADPAQVDRDAYVVRGERRWTFFARTRGGRILFVVYTMREDRVRVISVRNAEDNEKRIYRTR